jgi:hypothetical protein
MPNLEASVSNSVRTLGNFGRLAAQFPEGLRELPHYVAGDLPKAPAKVDVPAVSNWMMLGNGPDPSCTTEPDEQGDCGVAGIEHGFMATASVTGETETFPDGNGTVAYYLAYTGGQDTGVVLSQFLAYVRKHGYYGHTVEAYAPVAVHDVPTLQSAIFLFDFAYTGIAVTAQMQQDFANGQPWTLESLMSPVVGGHCIPIVAYDSQHLYAVTWGQVQPIAYSAWHYMSSEAWAVLTGEITARGDDGHGVNVAALKADLPRLDDETPAPAAA